MSHSRLPDPKKPGAFDTRALVLVEGESDQRAIEALARRRHRDLEAEGVAIVSMRGATNIGAFLERFGPQGLDVRLAGLCDAAEESDFRHALERAGLGSDLTREDLERLGFYVCVEDLEDELIRALGAAAVERVVDVMGDLGSFRTFQRQPTWRERTTDEQLRRFLGPTAAGRSVPHPFWSRPSTSPRSLGHWPSYSPTSDAARFATTPSPVAA